MSNFSLEGVKATVAGFGAQVQNFFSRSTPVVAKTIEAAPAVIEKAVVAQQQPVVAAPKTRFERFKEAVNNNPGKSIAVLAAAIFAVLYGVDKYRQNKFNQDVAANSMGPALLESEKEIKTSLYLKEMRREKTLGNLDQFPGAKAILQKAFEEDDRFAPEVSPGVGAEAIEAYTAELSKARDAELALDAALVKLVKSHNLPVSAEPKKLGLIAAYLDQQDFEKDVRFAPSIPMRPGVEAVEAELAFREELQSFLSSIKDAPTEFTPEGWTPASEDTNTEQYLSGKELTESIFGNARRSLGVFGDF